MYDKLAAGGLILLIMVSCPFTAGNGQGAENDSGNPGGGAGLGIQSLNGSSLGSTAITAQSMLSLCSGIKTKRWNQLCNAVFSMDSSKCVLQREYGLKEGCEIMIVAVKKQPSLCSSINKYITGIDSKGNVVNTTFGTDCYEHYAVATLDKSYCARADSKVWCEFYVDIEKNEIPLERCGDHYKCVLAYAWNNNDTAACDRLDKGYGGKESKAECLALVTGDSKYCQNISDVDYKYLCIGYSKLRKAVPREGVFMPEKCDKNSDCEREVIERMEKWVVRH